MLDQHPPGRESEENFRVLFEENPLPMFLSELPSGKIAFANKRLASVLHRDVEDIVGRTANDLGMLKNHGDQDELPRLIPEHGYIDNVEVGKVFPDGSLGTDLVSLRHVSMQGKQYCLVVLQDITERKRAEEALQESEERFSKTFRTSPHAFVITNIEDGSFIDVNDAFCASSGFSREEVFANSTISLKIWVNVEDRLRMVRDLRNGEDVSRRETLLRKKTGQIVISLLYARVIRLKRQSCVIAIMEDITERKQAEEALRESEQKYRSLVDNANQGIVVVQNGLFKFVNKKVEQLWGAPEEKLLNTPILDVVYPDDRHLLLENREKRIKGELFRTTYEFRLVAADGRICWVEINPVPIVWRGQPATLNLLTDVTQRKRMEEELQKAQRLDSLGVLAGGIAHDFNNLLTGIFGYISLARSVTSDQKALTYLDATLASMNRARALTQQLLTFAKGGAPVQKSTPLFPFLQDTAQFALSGSNILCKFVFAPNLPPCNIDKNQIGQVIDNIVINAQQAMPSGGTIEIAAVNMDISANAHPALRKGMYVKVSIKDSGIGIPKEILPRIFDPFYTTKSKGHGLGLATCYSIMNRHGGCIDVESEPSVGSTFHVYLPVASETSSVIPVVSASHKGSGTIIVMDDEDIVRSAAREMLGTLGYTAICKADGKEAISCYLDETRSRRTVTAILFDLTVPGGMGGLEAVSEIRKIDKEIPVFVVSGYADNMVMRNPLEYGFTGSISKPFTLTELSDILGRHLKA
jgi:PAS domain S-box-containing protein